MSKGFGYSKDSIRDSGTPLMLYGMLYTNYQTTVSSLKTFADLIPGSILSTGNEVVMPSSGETAEDIAVASNIDKPGVILSGGLNIIAPKKEISPVFLALQMTYGEPHYQLAKVAQGKSIVHLYGSDIEKVEISFGSLSEQSKIGHFFSSLDSLITLHQRK